MPTVQPLTQTYLREDADDTFIEILKAMLAPVGEQVIKENKPKSQTADQGLGLVLGFIGTKEIGDGFMECYKELSKSNNLDCLDESNLKRSIKNPNAFPLENYKMDLPPYQELTALIQYTFADYHVRPSGQFYYPPDGYCGWHTNHDQPVERLYISYTPEKNKSFFRYYEDGKIVTDLDDEVICIRRFKCPEKEPYFWHCVGSETDRISFGFRLFSKESYS